MVLINVLLIRIRKNVINNFINIYIIILYDYIYMFKLTEMNILYIINLLLVIGMIYILFFKKSSENFETIQATAINDAAIKAVNDKYTTDIDAIRNLGAIAKKIMTNTDNLELPTNIKIPGNLVVDGNIKLTNKTGEHVIDGAIRANGNINSTADINAGANINANKDIRCGQNLFINDFQMNKQFLQRLLSQSKIAGFAVNNGGTTMLLYEGGWALNIGISNESDGRFGHGAGTNESWDVVYVNRGWKVTLHEDWWHTDNGTIRREIINTTSDIPLADYLGNAINGKHLLDKVSAYKAEWIGW